MVKLCRLARDPDIDTHEMLATLAEYRGRHDEAAKIRLTSKCITLVQGIISICMTAVLVYALVSSLLK